MELVIAAAVLIGIFPDGDMPQSEQFSRKRLHRVSERKAGEIKEEKELQNDPQEKQQEPKYEQEFEEMQKDFGFEPNKPEPKNPEVENLVLEQLRTALTSPELLAGVSKDTGKTGKELMEFLPKDLWDAASPGERQRLVQLLVESVTIYENSVKLELKTSGLKSVTEAYGMQNN